MNYSGKIRVIKVEPAATVLTADIRPDVGVEWIVLAGGAWHDDATGRDIKWRFWNREDDVSYYTKTITLNADWQNPILGHTIYHGSDFYTSVGQPTLVLRHEHYATAYVSALAAGKFLKVAIQVLERPENFDLALMEMFANSMGYKLPISSRE